jgi:hypothetical protein
MSAEIDVIYRGPRRWKSPRRSERTAPTFPRSRYHLPKKLVDLAAGFYARLDESDQAEGIRRLRTE